MTTTDPAALRDAVTASLNGTTFTLDGGTFSPSVDILLAAFLPAPSLTLGGASVDVTGLEPTATGTLTTVPSPAFAFLAGMTVHATFRLDAAEQTQVALAFTPAPASTWGIPDAVPEFGRGLLGPWTWGDAQFVADSATPARLPDGFPSTYDLPAVPAGVPPLSMAFSGTIRYAGTDPGLLWLLGVAPVAISGPVEWWPNAPRMDLATAFLKSLEVDGFILPLELHLLTYPPPEEFASQMPVALTSVVLAGDLVRGGLTIPFTIELDGPDLACVAVVGTFTDASDLVLDDVATLLGVDSLASQQGSFPALTGLGLQTVRIRDERG